MKSVMFYIGLAAILLSAPLFAQTVIHVSPGENVEAELQEALILAEPGTTIELTAGVYTFTGALSLDVDNVTVRGAGRDTTILDFSAQSAGAEGLSITSDGVFLEKFAVINTPGDGIKAKGVDRASFVDLRVEWTNGPHETNGAYGIYPVESTHVLVDNVTVRGASDAGIYVGQSQQIVVRNSLVEYNVAGIEIENSYYADVYDNVAQHNTGGILIFDLPNLPQQNGHSIRVYRNRSSNNDTANFAPEGNIVGTVPRGTGIMVMANRNVEIFENDLSGNPSVNILLASYQEDHDDEDYNPLPVGIYIHDNRYGESGSEPDKAVKDIIVPLTGTPVPDIVWDGVVSGIWAAMTSPAAGDGVYIKEAEGVRFANLQLMLDHVLPWGASVDYDIENYAGSIPPRDAVVLPQESKN